MTILLYNKTLLVFEVQKQTFKFKLTIIEYTHARAIGRCEPLIAAVALVRAVDTRGVDTVRGIDTVSSSIAGVSLSNCSIYTSIKITVPFQMISNPFRYKTSSLPFPNNLTLFFCSINLPLPTLTSFSSSLCSFTTRSSDICYLNKLRNKIRCVIRAYAACRWSCQVACYWHCTDIRRS